jgi:hypothetical protein
VNKEELSQLEQIVEDNSESLKRARKLLDQLKRQIEGASTDELRSSKPLKNLSNAFSA